MKLGYKSLVVLVLVVLFCNVTIASKGSEEAKNPVIIYVLADRNITVDLDADSIKERNKMANYWEDDLIEHLKKSGGYEARLIKNREEFVAGPDTYLLTAKIVQYNPGSAAARFWVSFGAGFCSMDLHIEFFGEDSKQIFAKDDHVASGMTWKKVARKLNENILAAITVSLNQAQQ